MFPPGGESICKNRTDFPKTENIQKQCWRDISSLYNGMAWNRTKFFIFEDQDVSFFLNDWTFIQIIGRIKDSMWTQMVTKHLKYTSI